MDWNKNLPPFFIGQPVIATSSIGTLVEGRKYTVLFQRYCEKCKNWHVGYEPSASERSWECCRVKYPATGYRTCYAFRFAPLNEAEFQAVEYSKVIEEEKVGVN